jgi:hypothetical protein
MQGESVISDEVRARYAADAAVEATYLERLTAARPAVANVVVDEVDAVA